MLKHVKIGYKLLGGFGLVMAIFIALAVHQLGVIERLGAIQDAGAQRAQDTAKVLGVSLRVSNLYAIVADGEINRNVALTKEDFAKAKEQAKGDIHLVESMADTPEEHVLARRFADSYKDYLDLFEKKMLPLIEKLVQVDKQDAAVPAMEQALRDLDGQVDDLRKAALTPLEAIVVSLAKENDAGDKAFDDERATASRLLLAITGLSALLALAISLLTARSVTRPLARGIAFAQHLAQGDLGHTLDVQQRDELGNLADALRLVAESEKSVAELTAHIAKGDLAVEVRPRGPKDTMLLAMGELVASERLVAKAAQQLAEGDLEVSFTPRAPTTTHFCWPSHIWPRPRNGWRSSRKPSPTGTCASSSPSAPRKTSCSNPSARCSTP